MRVTLGRDVAVCVVITAAPRRAARACLHALRSRRAPRQSALSFAGRGVPQLADLAEFVPSLQDGSHTPRQDRGLRCQPHRRRGRRRLACRVQRGRAFARGVSHDRREASRAEHSLVTARKRRLRQPARCTCATLSLPNIRSMPRPDLLLIDGGKACSSQPPSRRVLPQPLRGAPPSLSWRSPRRGRSSSSRALTAPSPAEASTLPIFRACFSCAPSVMRPTARSPARIAAAALPLARSTLL